ncbi:MAG TPA: hypothetical protein VKZ55_07875 [Microthrixaceae bacterium]|nr:hypothetical protein [Microthrixaceae bacterium]
MTEHTILAAFVVEADTYDDAERELRERLPQPALEASPVVEWWIAEDRRRDGSDSDSAVFVTPGAQRAASRLLHREGYTPAHNVVDVDPIPQFAEVDEEYMREESR